MDYKQLEKEQYKRVAMGFIRKYIEIDLKTNNKMKENQNFLCGILYGLEIADVITHGEFVANCKEINKIYEGGNEQ